MPKIVYRAYYDGDPLNEFDSEVPAATWNKLRRKTGLAKVDLERNRYSVRRIKLEDEVLNAAVEVAEAVAGPKVGLVKSAIGLIRKLF